MSIIDAPQKQRLAGQANATTTDWSDADVKTLKKLWRKGDSAGQIANELSGKFTRSAVLGKISRLNLTRNPTGRRVERAPSNKPTPERRNAFKPAKPVNEVQVESISRFDTPPDGAGITFDELKNDTCRWPKGTPGEADFTFCGDTSADLNAGRPYCPHHARIARPQ